MVDLFATRLDHKLADFVSPFRDSMALATNPFLYDYDY